MSTDVRRPEVEGGPPRGGRIRGLLRRHPRAVASVLLAGIALAVFGFLWFRPDKLFTDTTVDEALPTVPAPAATGSVPATDAPAPTNVVLSTGRSRDLEHPTNGLAKIIRLADGKRIVRLENFSTSSGPDVVVWLSSIPATEDGWRAYDDGIEVDLGALRANNGNQNYAIPADVDLSKYRSVVIWCRRFTVGFGAAPISAQAT
jgi:hypothetical protein